MTDELVINHNQKASESNLTKGNQLSSVGRSDVICCTSKCHEKIITWSAPHPWVPTTVKAHSDQSRHLGFSRKGKYLARCGIDDALQRSSSNTNQKQSTVASCEMTDELVINHNQKASESNLTKDDALQRSSSNTNQKQSTVASCEMTDELVINHNQKASESNLTKDDALQRSSSNTNQKQSTVASCEMTDELVINHNQKASESNLTKDTDAINNSHSADHRDSSSSDVTNNDDIVSSSSEGSPIPARQKEKFKMKSNKAVHSRRYWKIQHNKHNGSNRSSLINEADEHGDPFSKHSNGTCRKLKKTWSSHFSNNSSLLSPSQISFGNETKQRMFYDVSNFDNFTKALTPPLRQHTKLNLPESELVKYLKNYIIDPNMLKEYGYPTEYELDPNRTVIYKNWHRIRYVGRIYDLRNTQNAAMIINTNDGLEKRLFKPQVTQNWEFNSTDNVILLSGDSGQGSGSSSPPATDSDNCEMADEESMTVTNTNLNCNIAHQLSLSKYCGEKKCVRCHRKFLITNDGQYLTQERCVFHWGKLERLYCGGKNRLQNEYTCCSGDRNSKGCTENRLHVWTGISNGVNGPFNGFVKTQSKCNSENTAKTNEYNDHSEVYPNMIKKKIRDKSRCSVRSGEDMLKVEKGAVYALDCEMCFTGFGLEVTKVTIVGADGRLIYECYVRPECEIVDYNTRFSGVSEKDLSHKNAGIKTLAQAQNDLLQLFDSDTILIGHALDNDLRVLKMIHKNVIDTSILFPHFSGFPYRRSLKTLVKTYLKRDIQTSGNGHSSFEDSRACLELMLWRVRKDFRTVLET